MGSRQRPLPALGGMVDHKWRWGDDGLRSRARRTSLLGLAAMLVAAGCTEADASTSTVAAPPMIHSAITAPAPVVDDVGPPPITTPPARPRLLHAPAAVPNGQATANTIGSEAVIVVEPRTINTIGSEAVVAEPRTINTIGSRTINTIGSEAISPRPEPDPQQRVGVEAEPAVLAYRASGAETLVANAIVPTIKARSAPRPAAPVLSIHDHPTKRGVPLVFQVLQGPVDGWVEVLLPIRPNGVTGWIAVDELELTRNRYRLDLDVGRHQLTLFRDGKQLLQTEVALGNGATPTPIGQFYLTELLRPPDPTGIYGPFAYGLSGFSESLDSFNGGPGIIGIHGTNQPELLGTDVSHGCVRVDNDIISEMATFLPLGTPVAIHHGPLTLEPTKPF